MQMDESIQFDRQKFEDVIHFICHRCRDRVNELGKVKLHKILYFADMLTYLETGQPLTGAEYNKQGFGPVARHLSAALRALEKAGRVRAEERTYFGFPKFDFISTSDPNLSRLSAHERALLDELIAFVCSKSAAEISELSHKEPWRLTNLGERIPYYSAYLLVPAEVTDADRDWADVEARQLQLIG
jgi:uncharacterized phage-associated protein